ncbi:hypothetical protein GCM10027285_16950 [Oleiagrimonas citrea]
MIEQCAISLAAGVDVVDMMAALPQAGTQASGDGIVVFGNQDSQWL